VKRLAELHQPWGKRKHNITELLFNNHLDGKLFIPYTDNTLNKMCVKIKQNITTAMITKKAYSFEV